MSAGVGKDRLSHLELPFGKLVRFIAILTATVGLVMVFGWILEIKWLLQPWPGFNPMRFNTALALVASGCGLWFALRQDSKGACRSAIALGSMVCAIGSLTGFEYLFGWNLHIDQLFFNDLTLAPKLVRMVPETAAFFVVAGLFLIFSGAGEKTRTWLRPAAGFGANLIAQGAILDLLFRDDPRQAPAIQTAVAILVLSLGMLFFPGARGPLAPLLNWSAGGRIMRRLFPAALLAPLLTGWLYEMATGHGGINPDLGITLMVLLYSTVLALITVWTANSLDNVDLWLSAVVDSSEDAIFSKTSDGTIVTWNRGAERLYGYSPEEVIGRSMLMLASDDQHAEQMQLLERIRRGESIRQHDTSRLRKDGTLVSVSVTASPFRNARGEITGCSVVVRDISEHKAAEQKLREAARYTRSLIEASPDPLVTISQEGKITDVNEATVKVTGLSRERLMGTEFASYFSEQEKATEGYRQVLAEGHVTDYPLALRHTSGRLTHVLYNASIYRDEKGEPAGVFAAARDITERRAAENKIHELNRTLEKRVEQRTAELRESEQEVRRKLDSILSPQGDVSNLELRDILDVESIQPLLNDLSLITGIPLAIIDLQGNVVVTTPWHDICAKFHRVHPDSCQNCIESDCQLSAGVPAGEFKIYKCKNNMWDVATPIMLGDRCMGNLFTGQFLFDDEPVDIGRFIAQARRYGFNEQEYISALHRVPRVSRERVESAMGAYSKLASVLSVLGYSGVKLARAMAASTNANAELKESATELERFAYAVSHDLRAPLRHLDGFLTLLFRRSYASLDDQGKHYIDNTLQASQRMGRLIDELLQFSRLGRAEMRKTLVDVNQIIDAVRNELEPEARGRTIEWRIADLPPVMADPPMLRQVIENLLGNALKFTRNRPAAEITIGARTGENEELIYFVADNGAGFDMRYYDKLFQVFQRLHGEEEFEGTGIGLANVRRIVERHGGAVWAEAAVDHGAKFYFSLPYVSNIKGEKYEHAETHSAG